MKQIGRQALRITLVCCLLLARPQLGLAQELNITVEQALEQAFTHNSNHSLFIWEQELVEAREKLKEQPTFMVKLEPAKVTDGVFGGPEGSVTMQLPLGQHLDLNSSLSVELSKNGVGVTPTGKLGLDYSFFSLPEPSLLKVAGEDLLNQSNSLVCQTLDRLIELKQKLDRKDYELERHNLLANKLQAAAQTPGYDDLSLKKEVRAQATLLEQLDQELAELQFNLAQLLGAPTKATYLPDVSPRDFEFRFEEADVLAEAINKSAAVRVAREKLNAAENKLALERRSGGWDIKASGQISQDLSWNLGLTATKTLYPRSIILEELELAVAKAQSALEAEERAVRDQIRLALRTIQNAQNNMEQKSEQLSELNEKFLYRQRQFTAGLITELELHEAHIAVSYAKNDYVHSQLAHSRSILELWRLCGRELRPLVFEIVR